MKKNIKTKLISLQERLEWLENDMDNFKFRKTRTKHLLKNFFSYLIVGAEISFKIFVIYKLM